MPRQTCAFDRSDIAAPIFCAWWRLESLANRHVFGPVGLSSSTFRILALLAHGSATHGAILQQLDTTKSNLSQRLRGLEDRGLVRRTNGTNRHTTTFALTVAGRRTLTRAATLARRHGLEFDGAFTRAELDAHSAFFTKLLDLIGRKEQELNTTSDRSLTC